MKEIPISNWKDAQLDDPKNWDKYIGSIWANIILKTHIPQDGIIIEIAPGVAEKVGRGLEMAGFHGSLYVIEPEESCLKQITEKYREHIPGCKVIPIQKTMEDSLPLLPKKVDAILANHPLDDMILGNSLSQEKFKDYFGEKFGTSAEKTKFFWGKLEQDRKTLEKIKSELVSSWKKLIKHTNPSVLAISQYKSYYFQKNKILAPDNNAFDVLSRLKKEYSKQENKTIMKGIKAIDADLSHWMILEF